MVGEKVIVAVFFSPDFMVPVILPPTENGAGGWIIEEITRSASPVFVISSVTGVVLVPKSTNRGFVTRFGTGTPVPVPVRETVTLGVTGSLLPIANEALAGPVNIGAKRTFKVTLCVDAIVKGSAGLLTIVNGPPGSLIDEIMRFAAPALVTVIGLVSDCDTRTDPKAIEVGSTTMTGFVGIGLGGVLAKAMFDGSEFPKLLKANTR